MSENYNSLSLSRDEELPYMQIHHAVFLQAYFGKN